MGGGPVNGIFNGKEVDTNEMHPHPQYLIGCSAVGNRGNSGCGYDRNCQYGSVYVEYCYATDNHASIPPSTRHQDYAFTKKGYDCYAIESYIGSANDVVAGPHIGDILVKSEESTSSD